MKASYLALYFDEGFVRGLRILIKVLYLASYFDEGFLWFDEGFILGFML
jgi:hypothetical protein